MRNKKQKPVRERGGYAGCVLAVVITAALLWTGLYLVSSHDRAVLNCESLDEWLSHVIPEGADVLRAEDKGDWYLAIAVVADDKELLIALGPARGVAPYGSGSGVNAGWITEQGEDLDLRPIRGHEIRGWLTDRSLGWFYDLPGGKGTISANLRFGAWKTRQGNTQEEASSEVPAVLSVPVDLPW